MSARSHLSKRKYQLNRSGMSIVDSFVIELVFCSLLDSPWYKKKRFYFRLALVVLLVIFIILLATLLTTLRKKPPQDVDQGLIGKRPLEKI